MLLPLELFAAEALVADRRVRVGVSSEVGVPFGFAGAALRAQGAPVGLVGEGFGPVACGPGAVADATELGVGDAVAVADGELVA